MLKTLTKKEKARKRPLIKRDQTLSTRNRTLFWYYCIRAHQDYWRESAKVALDAAELVRAESAKQ